MEYVLPQMVVWQPGLPMPKIEPPSVALERPHFVRSRNVPNFSNEGF